MLATIEHMNPKYTKKLLRQYNLSVLYDNADTLNAYGGLGSIPEPCPSEGRRKGSSVFETHEHPFMLLL